MYTIVGESCFKKGQINGPCFFCYYSIPNKGECKPKWERKCKQKATNFVLAAKLLAMQHVRKAPIGKWRIII